MKITAAVMEHADGIVARRSIKLEKVELSGPREGDPTNGELDYAIEATDGFTLIVEAVEALGVLGTCAMVGGARKTAPIKLRHGDLLHSGKTLTGVMGGGGTTPDVHQALMHLHARGQFPLEKLVRRYPFAAVNQAIDDSDAGTAIKPILMM